MRGFDRTSRRMAVAIVALTTALASVAPAVLAVPVEPPDGSPTDARPAVTSATNIDVTLPKGRRISGRVQRADGSAIPDVSLMACAATITGAGQCQFGASRADGTFSLGGLAPGTYTLMASHPSDSPVLGGWYGANGFSATAAKATRINVATTDAGNIVLKLPTAPRTIAGKILGTGSEASGLGGVEVSACPESLECISAKSEADGDFVIQGVPAGSYRLRVTTAPFEGDYVSPMYFGKTGNPSTNPRAITAFFVVGGADLSGASLQMSKGRAIRGVLVGDDGTPLAESFAFACSVATCSYGRTASDGSFALQGVLPGSYSLSFERPVGSRFASGLFGASGFEPAWGYPKAFPVTATADVTLPKITAPKTPYSIAGTIRDAAKQPLAGVLVTICAPILQLIPYPACSTQVTTATGRYSIGLLAPGSYTVRVTGHSEGNARAGYWAATGWVADEPKAGRIALGPTGFPGIKSTVPKVNALNVKRAAALTVVFTTDVRNANATTLVLVDGLTNKPVAATVTYAAATKTAILKPKAKLGAGHPYRLEVSASTVSLGSILAVDWRPIMTTRVSFVTGAT